MYMQKVAHVIFTYICLFLHSSQESYSNLVEEDAPVGSTVATVIATDLDTGASGTVTFAIADGNIGNRFQIRSRLLNSMMWAGDITIDSVS